METAKRSISIMDGRKLVLTNEMQIAAWLQRHEKWLVLAAGLQGTSTRQSAHGAAGKSWNEAEPRGHDRL